MSTIAQAVRADAPALARALLHEPRVKPYFGSADHATIAAVILFAIARHHDTADAIFSYLAKRGCPFDRATVQFIIDVYDGGDSRHCLWWRDKRGRYQLLVDPFVTTFR